MNCKNCLCDEVCYKQDCVEDEILLNDRNDIEKYCQDFKYKSNFINIDKFISGLKQKLLRYAKSVDDTNTLGAVLETMCDSYLEEFREDSNND